MSEPHKWGVYVRRIGERDRLISRHKTEAAAKTAAERQYDTTHRRLRPGETYGH